MSKIVKSRQNNTTMAICRALLSKKPKFKYIYFFWSSQALSPTSSFEIIDHLFTMIVLVLAKQVHFQKQSFIFSDKIINIFTSGISSLPFSLVSLSLFLLKWFVKQDPEKI